MPDLLLELFSEEIPARMQPRAAEDLRRLVTDGLVAAGLTYEGAKAFATPRRLALTVHGVTARSAEVREERKGPRVGAPPQAIEGFLRAAGLASIDEAQVQSDAKKGEFYVAVVTKPGRPAEEIVATLVPKVIREFPWPKSMRWGARSAPPESPFSGAEAEGSASLRWVRPLRSILCTFGPETEEPIVVPVEISGIAAGDVTFGHRFMAGGVPIRVRRFDDYVPALLAAKVVLDAERRKAIIETEARNLAFAQGLELVEDAGLLEEVAGLVEWPVVLMGSFDPAFLDIPEEVVRLTIRANQKCFVLRDSATGRLTSRFVLTSNIEAKDGGKAIVAGNERVIAARLSDARFFWEQDKAAPLEEWAKKLESVTFHEKLGSQAERVERIARLARELAPLVGADADDAERAARLAKADLGTGMVGEFPELQGVMGRYYFLAQNGISAVADPSRPPAGAPQDEGIVDGASGSSSATVTGESPTHHPHAEVRAERASKHAEERRLIAVADAIRDHYKPQGPTDSVPTEPVSVAVALADKLDTLVGFWAINEKPTGSKDPFALRRAALGVIRSLTKNEIRLRLSTQIERHLLAWLSRIPNEYELSQAFIAYDLSESNEDLQRLLDAARRASVAAGLLLPTGERCREIETLDAGYDSISPREEWIDRVNGLTEWIGRVEDLRSGADSETLYRVDLLGTPIARWVAGIRDDLLAFFADRLKVHLREEGARHDLIDAVFALPGQDDLLMIVRRVEALGKFLDSEDGANLLTGYRRAANILRAEEKRDGAGAFDALPDAELIEAAGLPEEQALLEVMLAAEAEAREAVAHEDFGAAMAALAKLRPAVDAFFDRVTVNADDPGLRANRLKLLNMLRKATLAVADFSKIGG